MSIMSSPTYGLHVYKETLLLVSPTLQWPARQTDRDAEAVGGLGTNNHNFNVRYPTPSRR